MSTTSLEPIAAPSFSVIEQPGSPPWMEAATFPVPLMPVTYGYWKDNTRQRCSQGDLIEEIQRDTNKKIALIWTPESAHLTPPEEVPWLFDAVRTREFAHLKQARFYAIVNTILWGLMAALTAFSHENFAQIQIFNLVALGIIPLVENSWGLYRLRFYTPETMARRVPEARYAAWLGRLKAPWTWAIVGCISIVGAMQLLTSLWFFLDFTHSSITAAGIVKPAIRGGEWWRLLTGTFLHASPMHFLFNIVALFVLGKMLEVTFHRAYVPLVFVLSALSGSIWSLILLPNTTSVGASGGIMGLLGVLLVFGWTQRHSLPQRLRRGLLISVIYVIVAGLLAYQAIDNPAHVGGLATGMILGAAFTRHHQPWLQNRITWLMYVSSLVAGGVILTTTGLCLYMILGG